MAETKTNIPIEIKMGNAGAGDANLPAFKEGSIIFTKDTKKIYIDPVGETERIAVGGTEVDLSGYVTTEDLANGLAGKQDMITTSTNLVAGTVTAEAGRYLLVMNNNSIDFADRLISLEKPSVSIAMSGYIAGSSVTPANVTFSSYAQITTALQNPYVTLSGIANPTSNYQAANKKYVDDAIAAGGGSSITVDSELSGTSTNPVQNKVINAALDAKQDKIGTLDTHEFESGGIARTLDLGGHTEDYLYIQNGPLVVDKFRVPSDSNNSFSVGTNAIFDENVKVGKTLVVSTIKNSEDAEGAILTLRNDSVNISQAYGLSFSNRAVISNVQAIQGYGSALYAFAGSAGGSSFIGINNKKYVKIGDYNNGQKPISLLGISTPISAADTTLDITADDLPYQAANKKYVDDIKTELLNAINHPYTYDETTKELTLIL